MVSFLKRVPATELPPELASLSPDDREAMAELRWMQRNFGVLPPTHVHGAKAAALAHALLTPRPDCWPGTASHWRP